MSKSRTIRELRIKGTEIAESQRVSDEELAELRAGATLPTNDPDTALAADFVLDLIDAREALDATRALVQELRKQRKADAEARRKANDTINALLAQVKASEGCVAELERLLAAVDQPHRDGCGWTLQPCACGTAYAVELAAEECHHALDAGSA